MKLAKIAFVFFVTYLFSLFGLIVNRNEGTLSISKYDLYLGSLINGFFFDFMLSLIMTLINKLFPRIFSKNFWGNLFLAVCVSFAISVLGFLAALF